MTAAGTDGADNVTVSILVGRDQSPRSGLYALRGQGCGIALLADADDPDYWTTQAEFGLEEGTYMILTGPPGDTIQNASSEENFRTPVLGTRNWVWLTWW